MRWSENGDDQETALQIITPTKQNSTLADDQLSLRNMICPSCGHVIKLQDQTSGVEDLAGLPAGVKFDPSDEEILKHLEEKVLIDAKKVQPPPHPHPHPLIHQFIPTIQGLNGICYTHPENLPGVSKEGQVRHFFHRPSKAYTTGTRKRRKVHTDHDGAGGGETRWHKTGKTRALQTAAGNIKGYKKILVLYTNYGRQRKPEKTNWVMHQYHLGHNEEEKDGELVLSKVFYQTQPRQCGGGSSPILSNTATATKPTLIISSPSTNTNLQHSLIMDYYNPSFNHNIINISQPHHLLHGDGSSSFINLPSTATASKGK